MTTARHSQGARGAPRRTKGRCSAGPSGNVRNGQSPRPRTPSEAEIHRQVAAFLRVALPVPYLFTCFPAGGGGKVRGAQLKAMGLMPGFPDLIVLCPYGMTAFIGIELKANRGRLSPEQHECHRRIRLAGGDVFVCRSVEEVETALRMRGVPLRCSVLPKEAA